jgi:hypothetical protein
MKGWLMEVYVVNGYSDALECFNGLDFHGVHHICEADDEVFLALFGQHRHERVQLVFHISVTSDVIRPVHVHYTVDFTHLLTIYT